MAKARTGTGVKTTVDGASPHYVGHRQRLRERFLKSGLDGYPAPL